MKALTLRSLTVAALAIFAAATVAVADANKTPAAGDKAPLITGLDQDGKNWSLADEIGKRPVLLYFYPKDETPGCTKEACGFRDRFEEMSKYNVQIVGVSFDSAESHQKFIANHHLNFPLLADTDGKIADAYGVRMTGRSMARRVSFLIGTDGTILHVTDNRDAGVQLAELKEAVGKLPAAK